MVHVVVRRINYCCCVIIIPLSCFVLVAYYSIIITNIQNVLDLWSNPALPPPTATTTNSIPHSIFILQKDNDETYYKKYPQQFQDNAQTTIDTYRAAWQDDPPAPAQILTYRDCRTILRKYEPDLLFLFDSSIRNNNEGNYKRSILCQVVILYYWGGYYFDMELQTLAPVLLLPNSGISLVAIEGFDKNELFPSFLAAARYHPVLKHYLDKLRPLSIQNNNNLAVEQFQKLKLKDSLNAVVVNQTTTTSSHSTTLLLEEFFFDENHPYKPSRNGGIGCCCDFMVQNAQTKTLHFVSRMIGSNHKCDFRETPHPSSCSSSNSLVSAIKNLMHEHPLGVVPFSSMISSNYSSNNHDSFSSSPASSDKIPHLFVFTHQHNIVEQKCPWHLYKNVGSTIRSYRQAWKDERHDAPIIFLNDTDCIHAITKVYPDLIGFFNYAPRGSMKSDICRIVALYALGGYYFDNDMKVIQPLVAPSSVSFSTAITERAGDHAKVFFQSFLAAQPRHPVLYQAMKEMMNVYADRASTNGCKDMGTCTLKDAFHNVKGKDRGATLFLKEISLDDSYRNNKYPTIPRQQGEGCCCNYVLFDDELKIPYFYSRMIGAGVHCDFQQWPLLLRIFVPLFLGILGLFGCLLLLVVCLEKQLTRKRKHHHKS